jgi:hypothetical protein
MTTSPNGQVVAGPVSASSAQLHGSESSPGCTEAADLDVSLIIVVVSTLYLIT